MRLGFRSLKKFCKSNYLTASSNWHVLRHFNIKNCTYKKTVGLDRNLQFSRRIIQDAKCKISRKRNSFRIGTPAVCALNGTLLCSSRLDAVKKFFNDQGRYDALDGAHAHWNGFAVASLKGTQLWDSSINPLCSFRGCCEIRLTCQSAEREYLCQGMRSKAKSSSRRWSDSYS